MKRKNRKPISKPTPIISTPYGKLITPHTDSLGNKIGPIMLMGVDEFLNFIRSQENEVAE